MKKNTKNNGVWLLGVKSTWGLVHNFYKTEFDLLNYGAVEINLRL